MNSHRLLVFAAASLASVFPAGLAFAEDPPVVTAPPYVVTVPDTVPTDYCNVVIVVDSPVGPDGLPLGPGATVFAPCGEPVVIPPLVFDAPAELELAAEAPVGAARLGYVPAWVTSVFGGAS